MLGVVLLELGLDGDEVPVSIRQDAVISLPLLILLDRYRWFAFLHHVVIFVGHLPVVHIDDIVDDLLSLSAGCI